MSNDAPDRDPVPAPKVGDYVIRQITAIVDGKPVFGTEPAPRQRSLEQLAVLLDPLERRLLLIEPPPEREKARRLMWELRNALAEAAKALDYLERRGDALRNERDKAVRANELAAREPAHAESILTKGRWEVDINVHGNRIGLRYLGPLPCEPKE